MVPRLRYIPLSQGQYSPNCRPRHETFNHLVLLAKFTRPYEFFLPWHSCFLPFLSLCGLCRFVAYLNGTSWGSHITVNGFMVASYAMHNTSHWLPAYEHYGSICALKSFLDISLNVSRAHFTLSPKDERTAAILTRNYDVCDGVMGLSPVTQDFGPWKQASDGPQTTCIYSP